MWGLLLKGLKSWKLILGGVGVIAIGLFSIHYLDLKNTKENLGNLVEQQERELQNLEQQNEQRIEEYNALENSLSQYQKSLKEQEQQNRKLSSKLRNAGDNDEKLKECLGTSLPDDILDRLRE